MTSVPDVDQPQPVVRVLGVRHHGPGSARAVRAALDALDPELVLVEGPADADPLLVLAAARIAVEAADPDPDTAQHALVPPVAVLGYARDEPRLSAFWPMAVFSPEWQAIAWAGRHHVPVRFCDLPAAVQLAQVVDRRGVPDPADEADDTATGPTAPDSGQGLDPVRTDPIAVLAHAAGYDDPERWWDDLIESREHDAFEAITEAMTELRTDLAGTDLADTTKPGAAAPAGYALVQAQREAQMRQVLRAGLREGHTRIAVVCGAWHAPALRLPLPPAAPDARLLRGLPKLKVALTWVPWTHSRLSYASGYGAGIVSPGWYAHLFTSTERPIADWLTRVAEVLRDNDLPVSSAHVIEAVRLAETLATVRNRPLAGLAEVTDATLAVLCDGNPVVADLVTRHLVVGEALGQVPADTPTVPLEADLAATCRRLRLRRDPVPTVKDLDLRRPTDADRSRLLHRLRVLGVGWARPSASTVRSTGTFRETWELAWKPEFAVDVIEAAVWGTTVESAATAKVISQALGATLPQLTGFVEAALLADLSDGLPDLLAALDARAAHDHDISHLMQALPALVRAQRYGDVRGTDTRALAQVADALLVRICAGLPAAVTSLDDDGAAALRTDVDAVHAAVDLRDDPDGRARWLAVLGSLIGRADVHGLLAGRLVRLLLDAGRLDTDQAAARLSRALSVGSEPAAKAAWVEGFLAGSALLLVHDTALLRLLDEWVTGLAGDDFLEVAVLLRRTFGQFDPSERRAIGSQVKQLTGTGRVVRDGGWDVDPDRAAPAVATVARLLGLRGWQEGSDG